jgi:G protein-coupled receptor Mth (Methuselah protein)
VYKMALGFYYSGPSPAPNVTTGPSPAPNVTTGHFSAPTVTVDVISETLVQGIAHRIQRDVEGAFVYETVHVGIITPSTCPDHAMTSNSTNSLCRTCHSPGPVAIRVTGHISLVTSALASRTRVEQMLVNIMYNDTNTTVGDSVFRFYFRPEILHHEPMFFLYLSKHAECGQARMRGGDLSPDMSDVAIEAHVARTVSSRLICPQIELDSNEYDISSDTGELTIYVINTTLTSFSFDLATNRTARICLSDYDMREVEDASAALEDAMLSALYLFTLICTCMSLFSLLLTFLTYCIFSELRTLPGKNNMCLIVTLFCAQVLMQFGIDRTSSNTTCIVIGAFIHYFWLATFSSMGVCCFHIFRVFGKHMRTIQSLSFDESRTFTGYCVFAFGVPACIVVLTLGVNAIVFNGEYFGYGGKLCFLSDTYSLSLGFAFPVLLTLILNCVYFICAVNTIARTSSTISSNQRERRTILVYAKLFTLTGATWIVVFIDSVYALSALSFIATFLVGCQGMFIFVSYVCNRRVYTMYSKRLATCCRKQYVMSSSNIGTHSVQVPESISSGPSVSIGNLAYASTTHL